VVFDERGVEILVEAGLRGDEVRAALVESVQRRLEVAGLLGGYAATEKEGNGDAEEGHVVPLLLRWVGWRKERRNTEILRVTQNDLNPYLSTVAS